MGGPCAIEADYAGLRVSPMEMVEEDSDIIAVFETWVDLPSWQEMRRWLGRPYDYAGLFGFLWVMMGRWLGINLKNPARSSERVFCSESVVRILISCGFEPAKKLDPEQVSPEDLLRFCEDNGFKRCLLNFIFVIGSKNEPNSRLVAIKVRRSVCGTVVLAGVIHFWLRRSVLSLDRRHDD